MEEARKGTVRQMQERSPAITDSESKAQSRPQSLGSGNGGGEAFGIHYHLEESGQVSAPRPQGQHPGAYPNLDGRVQSPFTLPSNKALEGFDHHHQSRRNEKNTGSTTQEEGKVSVFAEQRTSNEAQAR